MKPTGVTLLSLLFASLLPGVVRAGNLLDDTVLNASGGGVNTTYYLSDNSGYVMANAVTVGAGGWDIGGIATFYSMIGSPDATTTTAELFISPYTGAQPTVNPLRAANNTVVPVSFTTVSFTDPVSGFSRDTTRMAAENLNVDLAPGVYWIGLTPLVPNTSDGSFMAWGSRNALAANAALFTSSNRTWGPPISFWTGPSEMMQIEGSVVAVPEPASAALFAMGAIVLLAMRVRQLPIG